ncbi:MAG: orotate phosphoribosyltransferase [Flavobacteriales bacterium CG_4_10_14_0_2_um_filter_32_8]|nr:MAG: orotate phosphoribosyltransferase [Flavobacteriales bacterium CG_4_10_14_0_2_um_filter_32_8]PJB14763.1 MAG: orotate phosphoribosyltransferase [Flavobacteriales bacterium CG_4_9_14_3_um_filter_32_8]
MILNKESAIKIAESLLQIKAIKLNPTSPFQWASGWNSPIYCDNRKALSYPIVRTYIRQQLVDAITKHFPNVDVIAGVATGGIAHGALVAEAMGLPFAYIRSAAKEHGMQNLIEGDILKGQNVVVVEDLISTGTSSLNAVDALIENESNVLGMVAIFTYGFELAETNFKKKKCKLITLSDYNTLIEVAANTNYISNSDIESLAEWRKNPHQWTPTLKNNK